MTARQPDGRASAPPPNVGDPPPVQARHDEVCGHIFTVSATMVGVCLTVIGVLRVVSRLSHVSSVADELLSVDAVGFLVSCVVAYSALRTANVARRRRIERWADTIFLLTLGMMTAACALVAWELI